MKPILKYSDYQQLFSASGMSYLTSNIYMDFYKNLDGLLTFIDTRWTTYLPKKTIEKTLEDGAEIFADKKLFDELADNLAAYYSKANSFFSDILSGVEISREQCEETFDLFTENYVWYSKTEFFYTDKAFINQDTDPVTKENLKKFESIKNESRMKMNAIFFEPNSCRKRFLEMLSKQFNIIVKDLLVYGKKDVLNLYSGVVLNEKIIAERRDSYLMYCSDEEIHFFCGKESREILSSFVPAVETGKEVVLKGIVASKGNVTAPATVIRFTGNTFIKLGDAISQMPQGNILIAETTGPELLLACKKASAILTNQGGMMSHAAIVSRELGIPCIVGLKNVTEVIKEGDVVEVDADTGIVKKIS
jgi:phosphoenolpyruvate synthase/pyruvate phosphate dikinase